MAPRRELSIALREQAIRLLQSGKTQQEVAEIISCSKSAVCKLWKKFQESGTVKDRSRHGRPRKTSATQDRHLRRICKENRRCTSKQLNAEWSKQSRTQVCDKTLRNRLHSMGYAFRKAKVKPFLTKKHRMTRLQWAQQRKDWTSDQWNRVIFSDECRICVGYGDDNGTFVWRMKNEKFKDDCVKFSTKFPRGIMIWACMSSHGRGNICLVNGTVNSAAYIDILQTFLLPTVEHQFGDEAVVFQDDNASCHRSRAVKSYLQQVQIETMEWPPNSPDLNPIENLWRKLKQLVSRLHPTNTEELKAAILKAWDEIDDGYCLSLVSSMPQRLTDVIKARGAHTKY